MAALSSIQFALRRIMPRRALEISPQRAQSLQRKNKIDHPQMTQMSADEDLKRLGL
jgi:hypothetical protein